MEQKKYFFAVDLGATSGRTIVASPSRASVSIPGDATSYMWARMEPSSETQWHTATLIRSA